MSNPYHDWFPILEHIDNVNEKTILEIGCGSGTSTLVDSFNFVYSYETNTRDKEGKQFNLTKEQNESSKNWTGFFDQNHGSNPVNISLLYDNIQKVVPLDKIDVLFVDAGFVSRAECIVYFCDRVKINNIIAHDTFARDAHQYNWPLTKKILSDYYVKHEITTGQGTTLWELND